MHVPGLVGGWKEESGTNTITPNQPLSSPRKQGEQSSRYAVERLAGSTSQSQFPISQGAASSGGEQIFTPAKHCPHSHIFARAGRSGFALCTSLPLDLKFGNKPAAYSGDTAVARGWFSAFFCCCCSRTRLDFNRGRD